MFGIKKTVSTILEKSELEADRHKGFGFLIFFNQIGELLKTQI